MTIRLMVSAAVLCAACGASPRHTAVVVDSGLYEVLADAHQVEQRALCGQPSCAGIPDAPVPGWSHAKSVTFNQALLPAVEGGRQLNVALAAWRPGQPLPAQVKAVIASVSAALKAVTADFPAGATKATILADLGQGEAIILNALDIYLAVKGS